MDYGDQALMLHTGRIGSRVTDYHTWVILFRNFISGARILQRLFHGLLAYCYLAQLWNCYPVWLCLDFTWSGIVVTVPLFAFSWEVESYEVSSSLLSFSLICVFSFLGFSAYMYVNIEDYFWWYGLDSGCSEIREDANKHETPPAVILLACFSALRKLSDKRSL